MQKFKEEVYHWSDYDYVVVNNDLKICYDEICKIIKKEKNNEKYPFDETLILKLVEKLLQ